MANGFQFGGGGQPSRGSGGSYKTSNLPPLALLGLGTAAVAEPTPIGELLLLAFLAQQVARPAVEQLIPPQIVQRPIGIEQLRLPQKPMGIEALELQPRPQGIAPAPIPQKPEGVTQLPTTFFPSILKAEKFKSAKPLIEEAKKYKTAEEFVGTQLKVYHGTSSEIPFKTFDWEKGKSWWGKAQKAYFFSDRKDMSVRAASVDIVKGKGIVDKPEKIRTFYLNLGKVLETPVAEPPKSTAEKLMVKDWLGIPSKENLLIAEAKKEGYNSIKKIDFEHIKGWETIYIVFSPEQIKTPQQLTNIWKQAQIKP